ncbi:MAG: aldose 1-epimerase [Victivallales bacterium]|nr:aldose 1-epimerase [Victivallales bacterium]
MIRIETPEWLAEILPDIGANLYRLQHKASGIEILRPPPSPAHLENRPEIYGIPILLPPNRIADGKFRFQGRDYVLPLNEPARDNHLHGLILGWPWQVTGQRDNALTMTLNFTAVPGFPHDFTLNLEYSFTPAAVIQEFRVINRSCLPIPFGLGFHTAFRMPPQARATVTAGQGYWEISQPRFLPSGKLLPWNGAEPVFSDDQAVSCHCPAATGMYRGRPFRGAVIEYPDRNCRLLYEIDEKYRHWCLWNGSGGQGFFCPEPMTWMINAPNLELPPEVTGMQSIEPEQSWQSQCRISVEDERQIFQSLV